jgi:hypothetical protein
MDTRLNGVLSSFCRSQSQRLWQSWTTSHWRFCYEESQAPVRRVLSSAWLSANASAAQREDHTKHTGTAAAHSTADTNLLDAQAVDGSHLWMRDYIIAAVDNKSDAMAAYYGMPAGQQLTALLKQHISIAVDLIKAAKAGDKAAQKQADDRWQANAVDIATFLSKANPNWPKDTLVDGIVKQFPDKFKAS